MTATRRTWISRCPLRWRAATLALVCSRAWRNTALVVVAMSVAAVAFAGRSEGFANAVVFYGPPFLGITVFFGLREHLARGAVWTALFQRPVAVVPELARIVALCAVLYVVGVVLLQGGALAGIAGGERAASVDLRGTLTTAILWGVVVLFATAAISTLTSQGGAALVLVWLLSPLLLRLLSQGMEIPGIVFHSIEFLLPPVYAVLGYVIAWRDAPTDDLVRFTAQLVTFPLLCVAIMYWRFRAWASAELKGSA